MSWHEYKTEEMAVGHERGAKGGRLKIVGVKGQRSKVKGCGSKRSKVKGVEGKRPQVGPR